MTTRLQQRDLDLETIDKLSEDARLDRSDREFLQSLRADLNAGERVTLTGHQRRALRAIRGSLKGRPPATDIPSLFASLPRPSRPPCARVA